MTIDVIIQARNMHVSKRLQEYAEKKIGKLDHYLPELTQAELDLNVQENARSAEDRQVAQLTLRTRGSILRAEEHSADMFASVDKVLEKIGRQIERYKGKRKKIHWRAGPGEERMADVLRDNEIEEGDEVESEDFPSIVRHKQFEVTPMSPEEAIEQMQLLGHNSFFVFYNADTEAISVLYRRKDGNYGLIDPEIG